MFESGFFSLILYSGFFDIFSGLSQECSVDRGRFLQRAPWRPYAQEGRGEIFQETCIVVVGNWNANK